MAGTLSRFQSFQIVLFECLQALKMSIKQLPHGIVKLISSTQVINSVTSVVKELVENSIDAGATVVDIKLEKYGLDKIEVRDNGTGINHSDIHSVCKPSHTSKIHSLEDLEALRSYGFRGEALNSICAVSRVNITTRTEQDEVASVYTFDSNGTIRETQQSHQMKGTTITITSLFKNVPVRRQYYDNVRKASEELKKIEKIVKLLSVIHPRLRVTISHNKCLIWHKTAVSTLKQSLMQMYQHVVLKNLEYFSHSVDDFSLEMLICKRDCNWSVLLQPLNEAILFFINQRPVKDKKVEKVIVEEMTYLFQSALPSNKCPLTLISLKLPPHELDVNLEPDKTKVFIRNHDDVLKQIRECITLHFYKQPLNEAVKPEGEQTDFQTEENPAKRPKLGNSSRLESENPGMISSYHSCAQDVSCNDSSTDSSSKNGDITLDTTSSITNGFMNEFEDCDMSALEQLLEHTEGTKHAENNNFNARTPMSTESIQQSANIVSEQCWLSDDSSQLSPIKTVECGKSYHPAQDSSEETVTPNCVAEKLNIDSVPLESSTPNTSSLERETISLNKQSASTYSLLKYIKKIEPEVSPNAKSKLSISGNLVDDLFQSQIADGEEIFFQDSEFSATNQSAAEKSPCGSSHERHNDIPTMKTSNSDSSTSENISSLRNGFRTDISLCDDVSARSQDDGRSSENSVILTQTTLSQWSKGHAVVNNQLLKGPSVLNPAKNSNSEKQINNESPSSLERSVSSQMGRKDMAGLTNFARSARLELIENNPGMSFTRIASELAKRWRGLDESQKNEYVEKAKAKKVHQITSTADGAKSMGLIKKQKLDCKTSIDAIKTGLLKFKNNKTNYVRIIKVLESGNMYLCRIGREIVVVDVQNLQRTVIHDRYVRYSSISFRCLEEPLELTERLIGNEFWTLLLSMDKTSNDDETFSISDPRVMKNGFKIVLEETLGEVEMWLIAVAEELEGDFVRELTETLQLASVHTDISLCRSRRLQEILRKKANEAFRDANIESDDVETLLEYWVQHVLQEKHTSPVDRVCAKLFTL